MSHVDFKKWPCRPVEFKGQGPLTSESQGGSREVPGRLKKVRHLVHPAGPPAPQAGHLEHPRTAA